MSSEMNKHQLNELLEVMAKLRDPESGCIWDKQQTYQSIAPHTLEEAYEVIEAIEKQDYQSLPGELGDLLFQVVFYAQIAKEEGRFDFQDVVHEITSKLIRRHPHVFSDVQISSVEDQSALWDEIKRQEKQQSGGEKSSSALDGLNHHLPAISLARKIQSKASRVGFDWQDINGPMDKINEELEEVKQAIAGQNMDEIKDELGDLLFACVNLARMLDVDPEAALRSTNRKFEQRFRAMEQHCQANEQLFEKLSLDEMETLWQLVKKQTK